MISVNIISAVILNVIMLSVVVQCHYAYFRGALDFCCLGKWHVD
jgi:hypothetical protein